MFASKPALRLSAAALLILAVFLAAETSRAASDTRPAAEVVKERRELMKQLGDHMRAVIAYVKGEPGSAEEVAGRATKIKAIADRMPAMFPEGTAMDQVPGVETGAKPEIWAKRQEFETSAKTLSAEAERLLAVAADDDKAAIGQQFMTLGKDGCSGCHEDFRHKLPGTD